MECTVRIVNLPGVKRMTLASEYSDLLKNQNIDTDLSVDCSDLLLQMKDIELEFSSVRGSIDLAENNFRIMNDLFALSREHSSVDLTRFSYLMSVEDYYPLAVVENSAGSATNTDSEEKSEGILTKAKNFIQALIDKLLILIDKVVAWVKNLIKKLGDKETYKRAAKTMANGLQGLAEAVQIKIVGIQINKQDLNGAKEELAQQKSNIDKYVKVLQEALTQLMGMVKLGKAPAKTPEEFKKEHAEIIEKIRQPVTLDEIMSNANTAGTPFELTREEVAITLESLNDLAATCHGVLITVTDVIIGAKSMLGRIKASLNRLTENAKEAFELTKQAEQLLEALIQQMHYYAKAEMQVRKITNSIWQNVKDYVRSQEYAEELKKVS